MSRISGNTWGSEAHAQQKELFNDFSVTNMAASSCSSQNQQPQTLKKTRKLPGTPDPNAEVIALSPKTLVSTSRFVCEICNKGFQREQNLQLHRRGHNLPWKLRQRTSETPKRVYVCPEPSCIHHNPKRALGDLTGIKKHYYRKHGEKKWKCERCSKKYAVQSDWKAHSKICGTREYKCECGTLFSRKDSFITHRAFCEVQAEDNGINPNQRSELNLHGQHVLDEIKSSIPITNTSLALPQLINLPDPKIRFKSMPANPLHMARLGALFSNSPNPLAGGPSLQVPPSSMGSLHVPTATSLLQKAAQIGATSSDTLNSAAIHENIAGVPFGSYINNYAVLQNMEELNGDKLSRRTCIPNAGLGAPRSMHELAGYGFGSGSVGNNGSGGTNSMTHDFMGIGEARSSNFQGLSHFHQQISAGQAMYDNSMWNI